MDINLTNWHDKQRTKWPYTGLEPKLQVVGGEIYYEYFGQDPSRAWQIWTAQSKTDGSDWKTVQRTFEKEGYRTEQEGNLQVVGGQIYNGWPEKDGKDDWQLWTAISKKDGSDFRPVKRTADSGWIPNLQVAGDRVYYMYPTIRPRMADPSRRSNRDTLLFAVSDKNGDGWRVIREIKNVMLLGWGAFQVSKGKIYFSHAGLEQSERASPVYRIYEYGWFRLSRDTTNLRQRSRLGSSYEPASHRESSLLLLSAAESSRKS